MLQTLFYIPCEIAGWPVFGFGLLLAAWTVASVGMLAWLVWKQGFNADTRGYVPLWVIVGAVIAWVLPALCEPPGLPIRGYGATILLAVIAAISLAAWRARRAAVNAEMVLSLAFWLILPGIVGARAVYVAEYWTEQYWPVYHEKGLGALAGAVLNVANGGLVVYGALLGGVAGFLLFWWKHRMPLLATADLLAPSLMLGLAIGRIGCLMNGCCYGKTCELPWAMTFPWNSPVHLHQVFHGDASVFGWKLAWGPRGAPVVGEVEPGSPAQRAGLAAKQRIYEINGVRIDNDQDVYPALSSVGKLHLLVRKADGNETIWPVDDPPAAGGPGTTRSPAGHLRIFGLDIIGGPTDPPVIAKVRAQSAEEAAGLRPGQRIEKLNGRPVRTLDELAGLIELHRTHPWLAMTVGSDGSTAQVEVEIPRPLPRSLRVHPTQVYSSIDALLLCLLLLAWQPFSRRDGEIIALMLTIYPVSRFLVERLRSDEANILGTGMHISQNISLGVLAFAIGLWIYILRRPRRAGWGLPQG